VIDKEKKLAELHTFLKRDKFSAEAWDERGLNPSDSAICEKLAFLFNNTAEALIEAVNADKSQRYIKETLKKSLKNFIRSDYDTEEREFVVDLFAELSFIVGVSIKDNLSAWLYGRVLTFLMKIFRKKERVLDVISQDCQNCGSKLETFIIQRDPKIGDMDWMIVQCNSCKAYNLIQAGTGIKQLRFGNYRYVETLSKQEYTPEQAILRFEQIKTFRQN
jgi:hypothetical protein